MPLNQCLLSGVKRTSRRRTRMSAFDPKRTWRANFAVMHNAANPVARRLRPASLRFFVSTPHACHFFGLAGDSDVRAARVLTQLSAHTVHTSIGPFQAIFVALPIALHPIGRWLTRFLVRRSCLKCHQYDGMERPHKLEQRSREYTRAGVIIGPKQHDLEPQLGLSSGCESSGPSKAARVAACQTLPYLLFLASHWRPRPALECFCRCSL